MKPVRAPTTEGAAEAEEEAAEAAAQGGLAIRKRSFAAARDGIRNILL
jgi:hypothetical protein